MIKTKPKQKKPRKPRLVPAPNPVPLLEPVAEVLIPGRTVRGWKFTRTPRWWFRMDIPAGTVLINEPATSAPWRDVSGYATWSFILPGGVQQAISEDLAIELLFISSAEKYAAEYADEEPDNADSTVRRAAEYATQAIEGKL